MAVNQLMVAGSDVSVLLPGKGHHVFGRSLSTGGSCK